MSRRLGRRPRRSKMLELTTSCWIDNCCSSFEILCLFILVWSVIGMMSKERKNPNRVSSINSSRMSGHRNALRWWLDQHVRTLNRVVNIWYNCVRFCVRIFHRDILDVWNFHRIMLFASLKYNGRFLCLLKLTHFVTTNTNHSWICEFFRLLWVLK